MSAITQVQAPVSSAYSSQDSPIATFASTPPVNSIILVAIVMNENSGTVNIVTPPAGFTLIQQNEVANAVKMAVYYRVATAGESTSIQAFLSRNACVVMMIGNYQGGSASNWIDVFASTTGSGSTVQSGSIATHTTGIEHWVSFLCSQYPETFGAGSNSFTNLISNQKNPGAGNESVAYSMYDRDLPSPTTGPATMSATIGNSRNNVGLIVALQERQAVTTIKTGGPVVGGTALGGSKSRDIGKTGQILSNQAKVLGARSSIYNRSSLLISNGAAIGGIRPAFYARTGTLKSDVSVLTGVKILVHGATIVRDTTDFIYGFASGKVSTTGSGPQQGAFTSFTPTVTNVHTVSMYLKSFDPVRIRVATASGVTLETSPTINPTINWTRQIYTTTMQLLAGTTYRLYVETTQAVATTFWLDGVQVEEGLVASPFTVGVKSAGGGPVGAVLREQKPAGLVMTYVVAPGSPTTYPTYQELYDHHTDYTHVMDTEQDYQQVFLAP